METGPLMQCCCDYRSTHKLKGGGVIRSEKQVWIILKFMSVRVHVSAPGNVEFKTTPASQSTYGHVGVRALYFHWWVISI